MTATLDLQTRQGSTFRRRLTFQTEAGVAVPLTGFTIRGQVRKFWDGDLIASFTVVEIDLAGGVIELLLLDTLTDTLLPGNSVYDLELVDPTTGDISCPIRGTFSVLAGATR